MYVSVVVVFALLGAVRAQFDMLSPRFAMASPALDRRQAASCPAGQHSCADINQPGFCCDKNHFCLIQNATSYDAICCAIDSTCSVTACDASASFLCPKTITTAGTTTTSQGCCARSCPSPSAFKCPGGNCCSFDSTCGSNGGCTATTGSKSGPTIASGSSSGCKSNQPSCATSTAGAGHSSSSGGGLSAGAKAGIGVAVALGGLALLGALLWFFVVHRRRARRSQESGSVPPVDPSQGGGSEKPAASKAGSKRPSQGRAQTSDYIGPEATPGPFTEGHHDAPATSPGTNRGVPAVPHGPGDIASPVEIDGRQHSEARTPKVTEQLNALETVQDRVELA